MRGIMEAGGRLASRRTPGRARHTTMFVFRRQRAHPDRAGEGGRHAYLMVVVVPDSILKLLCEYAPTNSKP
jgi:hypothetical protein